MNSNNFALIISTMALITMLVVAFMGTQPNVVEQKKPDFTSIQFVNARSIQLPDSISFAGERVPLEIPDVKERLDKELHINSYWHNNTIFLIKRANRWFPVIEPILKENNIPEDFKYLALIESGFQNVKSPAGAEGFWQILKGTAREYNLQINRYVDERYHPVKSTEAASKYLKWAYGKFNSWTTVAASYNRGVRGMQNAIENQQTDDYYELMLNDETYRYVFRILAIKQILENPKSYGFDIKKEHLYEPYKYQLDTVRSNIKLVDYAISKGLDYKTVKIYNPWLNDDELKIRGAEYYVLYLPAKN